MPYTEDHHGIYRIVNLETRQCYVGGSKRVRKRVAEHFRLLRKNIHPNYRLQESFNQHGEKAFEWATEVFCEDPSELDMIEEAFLSGEASFKEPTVFNISTTAKMPMAGRRHTEETRKRISQSKKENTYYKDPEFREKLREGQRKRLFSDKKFVEKVRFLIDNPHLSYAERGRRVGLDTGSARKLALKYSNLKGHI